jgi:hypothetical protein
MTSTLDRLDTDFRLPFDEDIIVNGSRQQLADYLRRLIKAIQEFHEKVIQTTNLSIDLADGEAVYFGTKNSSGEYPNNTWRLIQTGGDLEIQKKISGEWTKIAKHSA